MTDNQKPVFVYSNVSITKQKRNPSKTAIVSISTSCLHPNTGVDEELRIAGGITLQQSISEKRNEALANGVLFFPTGSVVPTAAGSLNAEYIFHTILQPIMKITRLYLYQFQIKYLLGTAYKEIVKAAEKFDIQHLIIPVIDPDFLTTEESIHIAVSSISNFSKKFVEVTFVGNDVYSKFVSKYIQKPPTINTLTLSLFDNIEFSSLNRAQKVFSSSFQPDEDVYVETNNFSIGVTSKDPELISADVICIIVDKKLRPSHSSFAQYSSEIEPPISDKKKYDNKYVFVSATQNMPHKNTMCVVVESVPKFSKNKKHIIQTILGNIYVSILREANNNGFKSLVVPVITLSKADIDISIALSIYACVNASVPFKFHHITFYHHNEKVVNRFLYMLALKRRRFFATPLYTRLFLESFPKLPCDKETVLLLPKLIRLLWDTIPYQVKRIDSIILPVMHVRQLSSNTNITKITIVNSNIINVPARNGAVINAANSLLKFGSGIAKALRDAGGVEAANECDALMSLYRKNGISSLPAGSATITSCGRITHCSKMIHGIGPQVAASAKPTNEDIYRLQVTYEQIFRLAGSANMEVLVIPFISTGVFAIDMLQGMKIALYATLKSLPNYGIQSVIFVHTELPVVHKFRSLIGNKNELTFETRSDADAHLRTYCAHFVPSYSSSMTRKVDAEIERVWKITERLLISHPNSYTRNVAPLAATGHAPAKRKITPVPPGRHKRNTQIAHSDDDEMDGRSEVPVEAEEPGLMKRLKAALRQKRHRSGETEEQAAERKKKDAERQRKKRLSQKEAQIVVDDDGIERTAFMNRQRQNRYRERETPDHRAVRHKKNAEHNACAREEETDEQRATRLKKDQEQKAAAREEETTAQRATRLKKVKEQMAAAREEETTAQRATRLKKDQEQKAAAREEETTAQRATRLKKVKEQMAAAREEETTAQRATRLKKDQEQKAAAREEETTAQRATRLKKVKEQMAAAREEETTAQRATRLKKDQEQKAAAREEETTAQRATRLKKVKEQMAAAREEETTAQRATRLKKDQEQKAAAREEETTAQRATRLKKVKEQMAEARQNQDRDKRALIREKDKERRANARLNETVDQRKERQFIDALCHKKRRENETPEERDARRKRDAERHRWHRHDPTRPLRNLVQASSLKNKKISAKEGITVPEKILQLRTPTRKELGGNHPGVMSRPMKELRASVLYRTDEHGSAPAHGVWVCKEGRKMTQLQYFDPLTDPLCYPLIFPYGEGGFKYGEDKLFPKGTTREEAGYIYNDARMPSNIEESPSSQHDDISSTSSLFDEEYDDDADRENEENGANDDDEDMPMYSANSNPWDLSSTTRYQIARDVSFFDKNEFDYDYRPHLDIDMQGCSEDAVEFGYSSDEDNNEHSDEDEDLVALVAAISMEESYDQAMDSPNEALTTQIDQEPNGDDQGDGIVEVPDDEAEFDQSEIVDGDEAIKETKRIMCGASTHQLSQFFIIDQYLRMVKQRNDYARNKLVELRGSSAKSFMMAVLEKRADKNNLNVGYSFSLSRKTPGSVAWYREKYVNAMIMIDKVGHPDIFLTFTGNRTWPECTDNFGRNSDWQSNPIILCEVFHKKSQELLNDVVNRELFGRVAGYAYSIEFQKRGMPHLHLLITLQKSDKLNTIERIEKHVWARIPELDSLPPNATEEQILKRKNQKQLQQLVKEFMVHSPCKGDVRAYCQTKLPPAHYQQATWPQCSKKFPKELEEHTSINEDGSVNYYRPARGPALEVKDSSGDMVHAGNEWVVPYNPYLLAKYKSHINVEVVSQTHVAKYMYKYIFKGFDRALVEFRDRVENNPNSDDRSRTTVQNGVFAPSNYSKNADKMDIASRRMRTQARKLGVENDGEATVNYDEAILTECFRQTTAAEAAWGLLGFPLAGCSHKVKTLHVHEPDNPPMAYVRGKEIEAERALNEGRYISPFMAYMNLNRGNSGEEDSDNDFFDEEFMDDEDVDEEEGVMDEEDAADSGDNEDEYGDSQRRRRNFLDDAAVSDGDDEEEDTEYWADNVSTSGGRGQTQLPLPTQRPDQTQSQPRATNFFDNLMRARNKSSTSMSCDEEIEEHNDDRAGPNIIPTSTTGAIYPVLNVDDISYNQEPPTISRGTAFIERLRAEALERARTNELESTGSGSPQNSQQQPFSRGAAFLQRMRAGTMEDVIEDDLESGNSEPISDSSQLQSLRPHNQRSITNATAIRSPSTSHTHSTAIREERQGHDDISWGSESASHQSDMSQSSIDINISMLNFLDVALYFRFDNKKKKWVRYERQPSRLLTYIHCVPPRLTEVFAIRLLAKHCRGVRSFKHLRTVNGTIYETFTEAAYAAGLMNSDREYRECLSEYVHIQTSAYMLRKTFASILIHCDVGHPRRLWDYFRMDLIDPRYMMRRNTRAEMVELRKRGTIAVLFHLEYLLNQHHLTLSDKNLPQLMPGIPELDPNILSPAERNAALGDLTPPQNSERRAQLNPEQFIVFNEITDAVLTRRSACYFLQASGGCGKTFLYKAVADYLVNEKKYSVVMVASTGIAATLLINGSTAHSKFCLPLNMDETGRSNMCMEWDAARELKKTHVIIFDESTMADKYVFQAIDILLRNIMWESNRRAADMPFGGKVILLGGDWKQLLPVVTDRTSEIAIDITLLSSPLWRHFEVLTLSENVRARQNPDFAAFLEETGRGLYKGEKKSYVVIDKPGVMCASENEVLRSIYEGKLHDHDYIYHSCVLTTRNVEANRVNEYILNRLPGESKPYVSIDTPKEGLGVQLPPEFFWNLQESGMPPHILTLKVGAIVILLRNLSTREGLCNGTRLIVTEMHERHIKARMLDPRFKNKIVNIGIMDITSAPDSKKAKFSRLQLPLRLAYCLTINKSQGQTFKRVGILLKDNVFAHGQLYVALSRVQSWDALKIYSTSRKIGEDKVVLVNKVNYEVIDLLDRAIGNASNGRAERSQPMTLPVLSQNSEASDPHGNNIPDMRPLILPNFRPSPIRYHTPPGLDGSVILSPARSPSPPIIIPPTKILPSSLLLLHNTENYSSLNAAMQLLRRAPSLRSELHLYVSTFDDTDFDQLTSYDAAIRIIHRIFQYSGSLSIGKLLEENVYAARSAQEERTISKGNACDVLRDILAVLRSGMRMPYKIDTSTNYRCTNKSEELCEWKGSSTGNIRDFYCYPITKKDEIVDLEFLFREAGIPDDLENGSNISYAHCESCCSCCRESKKQQITHDDIGCKCLNEIFPIQRAKIVTTQDDEEFICLFDIYQLKEGRHWSLSENSNLNCIEISGNEYRAVAIMKDLNLNDEEEAHFVTYTMEENGHWWLHDDAIRPKQSIGIDYINYSNVDNPFDNINMEGVVCILFQAISTIESRYLYDKPKPSAAKGICHGLFASSQQRRPDDMVTSTSQQLDTNINKLATKISHLTSTSTRRAKQLACPNHADATRQASPPILDNCLLLVNRKTDCFLNAAIQFLRRARSLGEALNNGKEILLADHSIESKARLKLLKFLVKSGKATVENLRILIPKAIRGLDMNFAIHQQDAMEMVMKLFTILTEFEGQFNVMLSSKLKCRDNDTCQWIHGPVEIGPVHYLNVNYHNQELNLEELLSDQYHQNVEEDLADWHCPTCCEHCDHSGNCACSAIKVPYKKNSRMTFNGSGEYAIIAFSILKNKNRIDWKLHSTCSLDSLNILGERWQVVGVLQHIGQAGAHWSSGHYVTYTREESDGQWWLHDDDQSPQQYDPPNRHMIGICGMLFQKIN